VVKSSYDGSRSLKRGVSQGFWVYQYPDGLVIVQFLYGTKHPMVLDPAEVRLTTEKRLAEYIVVLSRRYTVQRLPSDPCGLVVSDREAP
jgi:hypothetical protein